MRITDDRILLRTLTSLKRYYDCLFFFYDSKLVKFLVNSCQFFSMRVPGRGNKLVHFVLSKYS